jgi:outer membrane immunogenic protein
MPKRTGLPARPAGSAWDRWLLYAKGGAAWAGDEYSAIIPLFNEQSEASETRPGWTVGGGIEWAFWSNGRQRLNTITTTLGRAR